MDFSAECLYCLQAQLHTSTLCLVRHSYSSCFVLGSAADAVNMVILDSLIGKGCRAGLSGKSTVWFNTSSFWFLRVWGFTDTTEMKHGCKGSLFFRVRRRIKVRLSLCMDMKKHCLRSSRVTGKKTKAGGNSSDYYVGCLHTQIAAKCGWMWKLQKLKRSRAENCERQIWKLTEMPSVLEYCRLVAIPEEQNQWAAYF